jgi:hypothetical protein
VNSGILSVHIDTYLLKIKSSIAEVKAVSPPQIYPQSPGIYHLEMIKEPPTPLPAL